MKAFALIAILAVCADAQTVADLPACSLSCFASGIGLTECGATDYVCQCQPDNAGVIRKSVTGCLTKSACSISDLQNVQTWSAGFCPSVLSSAAATSQTSSLASTSSTASPSETVVTVTASSDPTSSPTPTHDPAAFGAGTPGTNWGTIKQSSKANRGPALEAVSIILLCITAMILAVRFLARVYTKRTRQAVRGLWWDEAFALAALIFTGGVTADIIVGTEYSMGKHLPASTTPAELVSIIKIVYAFVVIITACFGAVKMSILFLYLRMTPETYHKMTIYVIMGFVVTHNIAAQIGAVFQCTPIHEYWNLSYPIFQNPHCIDILWFDNFNNAWSVLEDIVIWVLPIPTIVGLRVPMSRKSALYSLLGISFISIICAVLRMAFVINWMRSADVSWNYPLIPFLSNMEACIALMTTSAPALLPLLRSTPPKRTPQQVNVVPRIDVEKADSTEGSDPEKSFGSQESTAVPSNRDSKTWSLLSRLRPSTALSKRASWFKDPHAPLTTMKSETGITSGPRTELKDIDVSEEDIVPGLEAEHNLRVK